MLRVEEVKDRGVWEAFLEAYAPVSGSFLHSWQRIGGVPAPRQRLGLFQGNELVAIAMVTTVRLPLGFSYAQIERGPIAKPGVDLEKVMKVISKAGLIRPAHKMLFVRFEPVTEAGLIRPAHTWARKTIHVSPEETLLLDLSQSEEELLSAMHEKTRYNIRLSSRKGLSIRGLTPPEFGSAWALFEETARRGGFRLHTREHYERLLQTLPGARLVGAFLGAELLAVNLMVDFVPAAQAWPVQAGPPVLHKVLDGGWTRTYLHGASSSEHRECMAPYALHWSEITGAKKAGLARYDFWGISETLPAWKGITRFKLGFGGARVQFPGTFDYTTYRSNRSYRTYTILRTLRRWCARHDSNV